MENSKIINIKHLECEIYEAQKRLVTDALKKLLIQHEWFISCNIATIIAPAPDSDAMQDNLRYIVIQAKSKPDASDYVMSFCGYPIMYIVTDGSALDRAKIQAEKKQTRRKNEESLPSASSQWGVLEKYKQDVENE
jgi:hypothetical protein